MKKFLVVLTAGVLLVGSIFAFGPARYQSATTQQTQVQQSVQTRLYRNLPEGTTLGETQTFKGTVKEYTWDVNNGFTLKVQVGDVVYDVHAGPIFKSVELKAGQSIEIVGKLATTQTGKFIVAEKVTVDGKVIDTASLKGPKGQAFRTAKRPARARGYRR
ncbi:hypothetical protein Ferpe_1486 [Fervidobacterium pennivorans DSM 9078]|uniref:Uncharacterized protein n=1 Tax=Fervidobacterium pennivorans (strain DSM 9078 / Ven5) TaxID=771875 RepID=H9UDG2_FERPD|nr:hypothetical protein [Fervidobacterium pennivorans]AFG35555.1 hypothetical protein Ferpe_1486 [Fervidobacterium pennivorans DSM 9078]